MRLTATVLALALTGCNSPTYLAITAEQDALGDSSTAGPAPTSGEDSGVSDDETTGSAADTGSSETEVTGSISGSSETGAVSATDDASGTGSGEGTGDTDTGEPAALPSILSLSLPSTVYAAGPIKIEVLTEHTLAVQVEVDGVAFGALTDAGDGLFVGELPVRGAIDNGLHAVEVFAQQGPHEISEGANYEVSTPKPGTMAWFEPGPAGSRTNRVALTVEGDVLEGGQIEINKVKRPGLRKRSVDGAEIWSVTLDTREGEVADLAVLPDGRVWVAMNVRKPGDPSPRPRIALFDAAGKFTGVEVIGDYGHVVRGIAADATGGCFAVGYASSGKDLDIAYWRVTAAGLKTLNETWDFVPQGALKHTFSEFAMDVVIKDDVAWIIGASNGDHDIDKTRTRGILVPMQLNTGIVKDPVIIAAKGPYYTQSVFFGAGHHPLGVLVTGYGSDDGGSNYQIQTALYGPTGLRLWQNPDAAPGSLRYGSDVVLDSQGRALVAGIVTEKGTPRGYLFARRVGGEEVLPLLEHWFPVSAAPSEALGVLVDGYDRIFAGGYITANGSTEARLVLVHG